MTFSGNSDMQQLIGTAIANRPYSHDQRVDEQVTAIITVEHDTRFLPSTLAAVLTQRVLPARIIIADCSGQSGQSVQTGFDVTPTTAEAFHSVPQSQHITVQLINIGTAKSFADAITQVCRYARIDTTTTSLWVLHDDSRPADERCLESLLDTWRNNPTAALLGAKQLDWEAKHLHNVGYYASHHRIVSLVVDGEPDQEQYDTRGDVFAVSLAGALIPMNTLASVQGINPWFTTYDESADFCRRLCFHGKRVVVVPQARIAHRRARFEGVRTREGQPVEADESIDTSMPQFAGEQKYRYTDISAYWWPFIWIMSIIGAFGSAVQSLFLKRPYRAWCALCMPWIAPFQLLNALSARHRIRRATVVSARTLAPLTADRQQIRQWHDRIDAFRDQQEHRIIDPLAVSHLRSRLIRRWVVVSIGALLALIATGILYWPILRYAFSGASLYSNQLLPSDATWQQLVNAATTPWNFGIGSGVPVPPTPWLLILMVLSALTGGHVTIAITVFFFLSAPLSVFSFWALAGVVTRSDTIRVTSALVWYSCSLAFGLYASANLAMLTVMVFLPGALALSFKAVGMYRTEQPVNPRSSVQAAAAAALMFIPVVAAEPQLLLALIIIFVAFLIFVHRHRIMLLLIPFPAAFALAPTLVNAVRYGRDGMWRQLFGDIMVPIASTNTVTHDDNVIEATQRALGLPTWTTWDHTWSLTLIMQAAVVIPLLVLVVLAVIALFKPSLLRPARIAWTIVLSGFVLALIAQRVIIGVTPDGIATGSVLPGIALAACGIISAVALLAGSAVKPFQQLQANMATHSTARNIGRAAIALVMVFAIGGNGWYGWTIAQQDNIGLTSDGLPMVASDYVHQQEDRRILAVQATGNDTVSYTVMRTMRGDLIDSSPAYRVSEVSGLEQGTDNERIAQISAQLLGNSDSEAIAQLSKLGFGGIYVVRATSSATQEHASEQLLANITASQGTQLVVSNEQGTYYRLTLNSLQDQHIQTQDQQHMQHSPWRTAWLWCLGILVALYCIVAIPRRMTRAQEE